MAEDSPLFSGRRWHRPRRVGAVLGHVFQSDGGNGHENLCVKIAPRPCLNIGGAIVHLMNPGEHEGYTTDYLKFLIGIEFLARKKSPHLSELVVEAGQLPTAERDRNHAAPEEFIHELLKGEAFAHLRRPLGHELVNLDLAHDIARPISGLLEIDAQVRPDRIPIRQKPAVGVRSTPALMARSRSHSLLCIIRSPIARAQRMATRI